MRYQIDFFLLKTKSLKMSIALIKSLKIPIPTLAKSTWIYCFLPMNKRGWIFFISNSILEKIIETVPHVIFETDPM